MCIHQLCRPLMSKVAAERNFIYVFKEGSTCQLANTCVGVKVCLRGFLVEELSISGKSNRLHREQTQHTYHILESVSVKVTKRQ